MRSSNLIFIICTFILILIFFYYKILPNTESSKSFLVPKYITKVKETKSFAIVLTNSYKGDPIIDQFVENKKNYANLSGYSFIVDEPLDKVRNPKWSKLLSILKALKNNFDWVWFIDIDTIITNYNIKIHRLAEIADLKNYDILITKDCQAINTGSILVKNTNFSKNFLETLWNAYGKEVGIHDEWTEQRAFIHFHDKTKEAREKIFYLPQNSINAYPIENEVCQTDEKEWKLGDFVIHFAGLHRNTLYTKYLELNKQKKPDPVQFNTDKWLNYIDKWTRNKYNISLLN